MILSANFKWNVFGLDVTGSVLLEVYNLTNLTAHIKLSAGIRIHHPPRKPLIEAGFFLPVGWNDGTICHDGTNSCGTTSE